MERRIMFFGPSGSGKTTLAREVSKITNIPFISGSYSDLLPSTKDESHVNMMNKNVGDIYSQDHQLLSIRSKIFSSNKEFISDRSYMDNLAYFILKLSKDIKECDTESFRDNVITLMDRDCTDLIFVPFTDSMIGEWKIEDNGKRVTNIFFQWQVSQIMYGLIRYFKLEKSIWYRLRYKMSVGTIKPMSLLKNNSENSKEIRVLILNSPDHTIRMKQIELFLNYGKK